MPAGTIALSNNSDVATGAGTSFASELKPGDFIVSTVGGVAYTLGVKSIESDTALTLVEKFTGPSSTGLSWTPIPYGTMTAITVQLAAQVTYAIRGLNLDKANWQGIFSDAQSVTVNLPDLNTFTGPGWGYISSQYNNKANKDEVLLKNDNLGSVADKALSRKNLGLGDSSVRNIGTASGTTAAGDDLRFSTINGKSGGTLSGTFIELKSDYPTTGDIYGPRFKSTYTNSPTSSSASFSLWSELIKGAYLQGTLALESNWGVSKVWYFRENGNAYAPGGSWISSASDIRVKDQFKEIEDPRAKLLSVRAGTWNYKLDGSSGRFGIGLIANDIAAIYPEAVYDTGTRKLDDGSTVKDVMAVEAGDSGFAAALHHANLVLLTEEMAEVQDENKKLWAALVELQERLKALDGLDA
ncbi:tail fiber domain-containing protein [Pantoea allii]|uniref:tail fiber domain-containing protein n=1 Tax=Pantoea allii TaxID=574096 RepID=UPI003D7C0953